jgi:hypothetical protein
MCINCRKYNYLTYILLEKPKGKNPKKSLKMNVPQNIKVKYVDVVF